MASLKLYAFAFLASAALIQASPCPYGQMFERGELSEEDSAKFLAARSEGNTAVKGMMDAHQAELQKREFEKQEQIYKRQLGLGGLPLGGGLLGGVLQPFTGVLQDLDVPTPQPVELVKVPDAAHPFQYATDTDVRGMCPTLNMMANHGYIGRDGITNFAEASNACQQTLGFGYDTCTFLSALGLLAGGDLVTGKYTIGGPDSRVPNTIGPALGASKHGPFEVDQSISRIDTYFGNQANFNLDRWNNLVNIANSNGGQFGFDTFNQERQQTYQQSRDTNPEFDAEVKHFAVTLAERVFMFRALPNGTDEQNANFANVAPFFLNETFPDDWFKRGTPYTLANVGTDIVTLYAMGPTDIGHNEGLNNFVPLGADLGSLTPSEMTCFLETALLDLVPGQISPALAENYDTFVGFFNGAVKPFFAQYDCNDLNYTAPGASAGDPTPGVSAGNILLNGVYQTTTPAEPPDEDGDGPN